MVSSHEGEAPLFVSTHSKILALPGLEQVQPLAMSSFQAGVQQHSPACSAQGTPGCPGTSHPVQTAVSEGWVSAAPCPSSEAGSSRMSTRTWLDGRNVRPERDQAECVLLVCNSAVSVGSSCHCILSVQSLRASSWDRSIFPLSFD